MHYYRELYLDEKTQKEKIKILRKIKFHAGLYKTYIIALSEGKDYFDLIPGYVFKQRSYPSKDMMILGLAKDYESAVSLATKAFSDMSAKYGTCFFKEKLLEEKKDIFTGFGGR